MITCVHEEAPRPPPSLIMPIPVRGLLQLNCPPP
jgi:hypothetical protein